MAVVLPTSDFVTTTLSGNITDTANSMTIGTGLNLPATGGVLQIDYDSTIVVGLDDGPETIIYTAYDDSTGAVTGMTRGAANTTGVAHTSGCSVGCNPSALYFSTDQLITSRKMAPTILEKVSTSTTVGITTEKDLTGATLTFTPAIVSSAIIIATFNIYAQTADDIFQCLIDVDGTDAGSKGIWTVPANGTQTTITVITIQTLTAAEHTIKLQASRVSGTGAAETYANNTKLVIWLVGSANVTNDAAG